MSWTYSGDPTLSTNDQVRFLVGDTNIDAPRVQDEEISFALLIQPNAWLAGALIAESLAARAAEEVTQSIGDLREEASARQEKYERLAAMLRGDNGLGGAATNGPGASGSGPVFPANFSMPWAGGLDIPRAFDFTADRLSDGRASSNLAPATESEWGPNGPRYPWQ